MTDSPKHLTAAECAAEYWRAAYDAEAYDGWGGPEGRDWTTDYRHREEVAERFATHPHAHKETR